MNVELTENELKTFQRLLKTRIKKTERSAERNAALRNEGEWTHELSLDRSYQSQVHLLARIEAMLLPGLTIGQEVTVWPPVGKGESRDTEPGLQPWKATVVGWTDDIVIVETEVTSYHPEGIRTVQRELVHA